LPVPHPLLHAYGIQGRVVDEDGKPVPNVKVVSPARDIPGGDGIIPKRETITDTNGFFRLKSDWGWHGAYCSPLMAGYASSMLPRLSSIRSAIRHYDILCFHADEFPEQKLTLSYWWDEADLEGNYIRAKSIVLHRRATTNYLATVVPEYQKREVLAILLCKRRSECPRECFSLKPVGAITDKDFIQAIISEMSVPAEMSANIKVGVRLRDGGHLFLPGEMSTSSGLGTTDGVLCMVFLFHNTLVSSPQRSIVGAGHLITSDGIVMNNDVWYWDNLSYLRDADPAALEANLKLRWDSVKCGDLRLRGADITWSFQSKAIADLVRNILSSEHPDFIVKP